MEKMCWMARLAIEQHFPIQILLVFLRFKLLPNFIFQCNRSQTWQFYLFFPGLSISAIHEVLGITLSCKRLVRLVVAYNLKCILQSQRCILKSFALIGNNASSIRHFVKEKQQLNCVLHHDTKQLIVLKEAGWLS